VWDWTKVAGSDYTYDVECHGLEKLWQEYDVGPDTPDGPRHFGIWTQTDITYDTKQVYALAHPTNADGTGYHVRKVTWTGQEVNQMNAVVCKWTFADTTTNIRYNLHTLFPINASATMVSQFYEGANYTDWIDYVESLTAITNAMPTARTGHAGDTLTATDGPWAQVIDGTSAWTNLGNAVGVAYYGFRYDENGQLVLKNLPGTRAVDSASRNTSESDATKTGQIRAFERLDDVYRVNDPCAEMWKYGVDSATGSTFPMQSNGQGGTWGSTNKYTMDTKYLRMDSITDVTLQHNSMPFCPMSDLGAQVKDSYDDTITCSSLPTTLNTYWRANGAGGGTVECGGGNVTFTAATTTAAAFIESPAARTGAWCSLIKVAKTNTNDVLRIEVADNAGANADATHSKFGVVFHSDGKIYINYYNAAGTLYYRAWSGGPGSAPSWSTTPTYVGAYAADTSYWVGIGRAVRAGLSYYYFNVGDATSGVPIYGLAYGLVDPADLQGGDDDYLKVGDDRTERDKTALARVQETIDYAAAKLGPVAVNDSGYYGFGRFFGRTFQPTPAADDPPAWGLANASYSPHATVMQLAYMCPGTAGNYADTQVFVYGVPYCPEVHTVKVADGATTGIDGATTVAVSRAAYGYKGLPGGTWHNPFLWSDAQAQTLANLIATMNLEPRAPYEFSTKFNPKYEPGDIFPVTFFDELTAANCEVAEVEHVIDLRPGGGGASTTLRVRRWTA
jgi:hypothetical protein